MIVVADTETDALAEAALVLMTDAESTTAREAVADLGLVNPSFILFSSTQKKKQEQKLTSFIQLFHYKKTLTCFIFSKQKIKLFF